MQNISNVATTKRGNNLIPFIPDGDFYFTKGVEAFKKEKFELALKWMNKAVESAPDNPLYSCQLSVIYTETGAYHKANQLLTNVLQTSGEQYIDCYYLLANNYAHLGLLNDAKKYANLYLQKDPSGDFAEEAKSLLQLIDMDDEEDLDFSIEGEDELLIYQETAFYHLERQEWDKALVVLDEMITLFPEHVTAKHEYAYALFFTGMQQKAVEMELELLEKAPNNLYSRTNLALFYYEMNQDSECKVQLRILQNVYPIHEQQKLLVAKTLARTGLSQEAYYRFRLLDKSKVKNHLSYYHWYSMVAYDIGKTSLAESIWREGCRHHSELSNKQEPWKTLSR